MSQEPLRGQPPESYQPLIVPKALKLIEGGIRMEDIQSGALGPNAESPIQNKIGIVFIPVRNLEDARNWYCKLLGLRPEDCQMWSWHLCGLPMEGTGVILDMMPLWKSENQDVLPTFKAPAFFFLTKDLKRSFDYVKQLGIEINTEIQDNKWFVVKDPDGNLIMICEE